MTLGEDFRSRAKQMRADGETLLGSELFGSDPKVRLKAAIGFVSAVVLETAADLCDYLRSAQAIDAGVEQRIRIFKRMSAVRMAAAKGDWDEFDRLAAGFEPGPDSKSANAGGGGSGGA